MKTIQLVQEKEKLSGKLFDDVKAGIVPHPLENSVSINLMFTTKSGKLIPVFIYISPKETSVDAGWSSLSADGKKEHINAVEGDVLITPFGNFELYETNKTGAMAYPIDVRPYEYITDYVTEKE